MSPKSLAELTASYEKPLTVADTTTLEEDITMFDTDARKNLDTTFSLVPSAIVRKPNINYIYFSQHQTKISSVPADLQLSWYFENRSEMARQGFIAKQEDQDMDISRGIWYYGLDNQHAFSRHHSVTRYNLVPMAYWMANNFASSICLPEARRFVLAFVDAWMSDLADTGNLKTRSFKAEEEFLKIWKEEGSFDLLRFSRAEEQMANKLMRKIAKQSLPLELQRTVDLSPEQIVTMRREGTISDADFEKFGPSLILKHILDMESLSEENRKERASAKDLEDEQIAIRLAARQAHNGKDPRRSVPWNSPLLQSLGSAVDCDLKHPQDIRKLNRDLSGIDYLPWIDMDTWIGIMKSGLEIVEREVDDVCDMFGYQALGGEE